MKYLENKKGKILVVATIVAVYSVLFTFFIFNSSILNQTGSITIETNTQKKVKNDYSIKKPTSSNNTKQIIAQSITKDKNFVYLNNEIITDADPETFEIFNFNDKEYQWCYQDVFRDKNHIFIQGEILEDADPETFKFIEQWNPWAYNIYCVYADKNYVYFNTKKTDYFDTETFSVLLGSYLKDKNGVYYDYYPNQKIEGADPETFTSFGATAGDKNYIYYCGQKILPNQTGYEILGNRYGKIDSEVYYKNNIIEGADARSFELFHPMTHFNCFNPDGDYAKDKNNVYFTGKKIEGADLQTFTINTSRVGYASDKNGEYNDQGERVQNDFKFCSSNINDLPEGEDFWSKIIPELLLSTNTNKFEFCLLPDGSKLIGYKKTETDKSKTIDWFNSKNTLIQSTSLKCENQNQSVGIKSLERLEGNELILSCLKDDACIGRDFYELDLNKFKISPFTSLIKTDEYYDCGYQG